VALKSRTAPVAQAVSESLAALRWLRAAGAPRVVHKICSTFDSTDEGNIGPVADAFADELDATVVPVCPAFPTNGRTIYQGYLFVGDSLLSESGMARHPLTPMTDASLVRVLGRQSRYPVTLVAHRTVAEGADAVGQALGSVSHRGYAIVDAVTDDDLRTLAVAARHLPLTVSGSALAGALAEAVRETPAAPVRAAEPPAGPVVLLSGSCSDATVRQVARWTGARLDLDPRQIPENLADQVFSLVSGGEELLVSTTAGADIVAAVHAELGAAVAARRAEDALSTAARAAVGAGAERVVIAGGETSGAVLSSLGVHNLDVGPRVSPGVPWMRDPTTGRWFVLKSGNFGSPSFFAEAIAVR
jgi:uncharacterized protein YgbK (DUF1537 family)